MVARHHEAGGRQAVEKGPRRGELAMARRLREIAADDDDVGPRLGEIGDQRRDDLRHLAAEMDVGDVRDHRHAAATGGRGTTTFSAPGLTSKRSGVLTRRISPSLRMVSHSRRASMARTGVSQ